ncbi:MAG: phytanoyl-CoA dioxygenase family protein [Bacteroidota bacterium]
MYLSQQQIQDYRSNGYLILPDMVGADVRKQLIAQANNLVHDLREDWFASVFSTKNQEETTNEYFLSSGDKIRVFMEEGNAVEESSFHRVNKLGHALHDLDPVFSAFSHDDRFGRIAEDIGIKEPGLLQSMYIFKQPRIGGEVNMHQDATFLYTEPVSVVGFWFAMQDATLENGCMWALPRGHRLGLKSRFVREGMTTRFEVLDETPVPEEGYVPLEVPAGTLILLHGLLPHYSKANRSEKARQAYALHVIDQATHYPSDNWLQRGKDMKLTSFAKGFTKK